MKEKKRTVIQIIATAFIIINYIIYYLYINDILDYRIFSIGDLNPYGGWSALKAGFTDVSYRWRGVTIAVALTISIALTSLLFGRFFCGYICPIGSLQDFVKAIAKKIGFKEITIINTGKFKLDFIKYIMLLALLILSVLGFGRTMALYSPWLAYINILIGKVLFPGVIILLFIIFASFFIKRFFCRFLCPLGAFQALMYAVGFLKIETKKVCGKCSACFMDCPVEIISAEGKVISPECINCLNCVEKPCFKGKDSYKISFLGKTIKPVCYIVLSITVFMFAFLMVPLNKSQSNLQGSIESIKMKEGIYHGLGVGFGGGISTVIKIESNKIIDIEIVSHKETSGYYEEVYKDMAKEILKTQNISIDSVSGATVTSRGFLNSVKSGLSQAIEGNREENNDV
jgi:uncharacterized protein with FMN-binding domain